MNTPSRWDILASALTTAGIKVKVDERPYSESVCGRVTHGVTRSITFRRADGQLVEINDTWWSKNTDHWTGYSVTVSDDYDIVRSQVRGIRRRSKVVESVLRALVAAS